LDDRRCLNNSIEDRGIIDDRRLRIFAKEDRRRRLQENRISRRR
jgi:hypothetical protein